MTTNEYTDPDRAKARQTLLDELESIRSLLRHETANDSPAQPAAYAGNNPVSLEMTPSRLDLVPAFKPGQELAPTPALAATGIPPRPSQDVLVQSVINALKPELENLLRRVLAEQLNPNATDPSEEN